MTEKYTYDLVCIGSGPAGQRAAVQAAKLGKRVAVIEKSDRLGGSSLETGSLPSKTFRDAVLSFSGVYTGSGFRGSERLATRPTSGQLLGRVDEVLRREAQVVDDQLRRNGVEIFLGRAEFVDPHTLTTEGADGSSRLTAANILIAVGTVPAAPPDVDAQDESIITSDGVLRLTRIPRTMSVVGAGVIGIEYASMFATLGVDVTLIDRQDRPLEFIDGEIVDELIHQMRSIGVVFRLEERVTRMEKTAGSPRAGVAVFLESGKRIESELVLFSIGRVGATESLGLAAAGLEADERGRLKVDEEFRTKVPHIFAAGDVIGYPGLSATSARQGRLAACFAFQEQTDATSENLPFGIYAIPEISMVGATEEKLTEDKVPYEIGLARYREIARGKILGDDSGLFKMLFHRETRQLLGVHIIGTGATELLHIGQAVMGLGGGLDYFLRTVFNYPTLAECYKVAALDASNRLRS